MAGGLVVQAPTATPASTSFESSLCAPPHTCPLCGACTALRSTHAAHPHPPALLPAPPQLRRAQRRVEPRAHHQQGGAQPAQVGTREKGGWVAVTGLWGHIQPALLSNQQLALQPIMHSTAALVLSAVLATARPAPPHAACWAGATGAGSRCGSSRCLAQPSRAVQTGGQAPGTKQLPRPFPHTSPPCDLSRHTDNGSAPPPAPTPPPAACWRATCARSGRRGMRTTARACGGGHQRRRDGSLRILSYVQ